MSCVSCGDPFSPWHCRTVSTPQMAPRARCLTHSGIRFVALLSCGVVSAGPSGPGQGWQANFLDARLNGFRNPMWSLGGLQRWMLELDRWSSSILESSKPTLSFDGGGSGHHSLFSLGQVFPFTPFAPPTDHSIDGGASDHPQLLGWGLHTVLPKLA